MHALAVGAPTHAPTHAHAHTYLCAWCMQGGIAREVPDVAAPNSTSTSVEVVYTQHNYDLALAVYEFWLRTYPIFKAHDEAYRRALAHLRRGDAMLPSGFDIARHKWNSTHYMLQDMANTRPSRWNQFLHVPELERPASKAALSPLLPQTLRGVPWASVGGVKFKNTTFKATAAGAAEDEDATAAPPAWVLRRATAEWREPQRKPWFGKVTNIYKLKSPTLPVQHDVVFDCEWYEVDVMCPITKLPRIKRTRESTQVQYRLVRAQDITPLPVYTWRAPHCPQPPVAREETLLAFDVHSFDFLDAGGWTEWRRDNFVFQLPK